VELPRHIKLLADYSTSALWDADPAGQGELEVSQLPITNTLRARLDAWTAEFDDLLDWGDPRNSGFRDDAHRDAFDVAGEQLARSLRAELGDGWLVDRFSYVQLQLVRDPRAG
jgi:hypothetical protein